LKSYDPNLQAHKLPVDGVRVPIDDGVRVPIDDGGCNKNLLYHEKCMSTISSKMKIKILPCL
jgi:hypothetical protein